MNDPKLSSLTNDEVVLRLRADFGSLTLIEQELLVRLESAMRIIEDINAPAAVDFSRQMTLNFA